MDEKVTLKEHEKFLKFLEENRNSPDKVFQLARGKWQKMVAVEFFLNRKEHALLKQKLESHDKLLYAILSVTSIAVISFVVSQIPNILSMVK